MDNIHVFQGGKATPSDEKELPTNDYEITTKNGNIYYATGFMIFTSQHVAVMQDNGNGAIPVFVTSLDNLDVAELLEDEQIPGG